ncbi:MAG TPA: response regulator [Caulobacteraceae bacterium]|nr:response regulator [Caulobacteraceae bacterium]
MSDLTGLIEYVHPIDPTSLCGTALDRFLDTPGCDLFAVVRQGQPVGVVARGAIRPQMAGLRVSDLMAPALTIGEDATLDEACALALAHPEPTAGLVVVDRGRYRGVISMRAILRRRGDDESAWAMNRRFVEMLNHELRTPMNGVVAVADLLQRQPLTADAKAFVRTIIESSQATLRTLNDALELSRAEAGELVLDLQPVALRELMDSLQTAWQARAARDGVTLLVGYDGPPDLSALADPARMQQLFDVLVETALSLNRQGAIEVSLAAEVVRDAVTLTGRVCDTGGGLSSEAVAKALAGDADAADASDLQAKLALSLCRRLVERMSGEIRAEPNPGAGVTVVFTITAQPVAAAPASDENAVLKRPAHVLVVDDNATNRMVAEALCEMFECTCECVEDGAQALEAARTGRFDLILMDIRMPRMDGVEATRAIRALGGQAGAVPIIALTANADPEDAQSYVAHGMQCVVEKPIKPEKLLLAMNAALPDTLGRAAA